MTTTLRHSRLTFCLAQGESNLLPDGTLWSHAAVMGEFVKGTAFTLDEAALRTMADNFAARVYQKVAVDYEHETVSKRAAGTTQVPWTVKGGDVLELAVVLSDADLNPAMRKQVDDETARRQKLSDTRPVEYRGLWIRWEPTAKALGFVQRREITELSIAFDEDYVDNTGVPRGPTLLSVALTNTPFLDGMISVAASRGNGGSPAVPGQENTPMSTTQSSALSRARLALSVLVGQPIETDEDIERKVSERLQALSRELDTARQQLQPAQSYVQILSAELGGETDPAKAVTVIRALRAKADAATQASADAAKAAAESAAETIALKHEAKFGSKPLRDHFKAELVRELSAGAKAGETATEKLLAALPAATNLGRQSAPDGGANADADLDTRIALRADTLLEENSRLKKLAETDYSTALVEAQQLAARELRAGASGTTVTK